MPTSAEQRRTPINTLPDELLSRIFTIGCEYPSQPRQRPLGIRSIDWSRSQIYGIPEMDVSYRNVRQPKKFAKTAMFVCKRWCGVVCTRGNAHLWAVLVQLPVQADMAVDFAMNVHSIQSSRGCDIYARFDYDPYRPHWHSFMLHTLSLLGRREYSPQLKALIIYSSSEDIDGCISKFLTSIEGATRLEWLGIVTSGGMYFGDEALKKAAFLHPFLLAQSESPLVQFPSLFYLHRDRLNIVAPSSPLLTYASLVDIYNSAQALDWWELTNFIWSAVSLKALTIDVRQLSGVRPTKGTARHLVTNIEDLVVRVSPHTIFPFFLSFSFPAVTWLSVELYMKTDEVTWDVGEDDRIDFPSLERLTWCSASLFGDRFLDVFHAPRMKTLYGGIHADAVSRDLLYKQPRWSPSPCDLWDGSIGVRSTLALLSQIDIYALTSMSINYRGDFFYLDSEFKEGPPVTLPNVVSLTFWQCDWSTVDDFLGILKFPKLTQWHFKHRGEVWVPSFLGPVRTYTMPYPLPEGAESICGGTRVLEVMEGLDPSDNSFTAVDRLTLIYKEMEPSTIQWLSSAVVGDPPYMPQISYLEVRLVNREDEKESISVEEQLCQLIRSREQTETPLSRVIFSPKIGVVKTLL